jgi:transposase
LGEYFPAALEAFDDWTMPSAWAFVEAFPTPKALVQAGKRKWEKFLHVHKLYRPETYEKRLKLFAQAQSFCGSAAMTQAKSLLALAVAGQLRVLQGHLDKFRARIQELFKQHPDHALFDSLPGTGEKLAPRLLAELGDDRERFDSPEALQCYAGTAPVSFQSGQIKKARFRRACQKVLRQTVHLWANLSRVKSPWAEAYYQKKREQGQSHACALRCLGQRWLKILWKMRQSGTRYDAELHQRNQLKHGSWVIDLLAPKPA